MPNRSGKRIKAIQSAASRRQTTKKLPDLRTQLQKREKTLPDLRTQLKKKAIAPYDLRTKLNHKARDPISADASSDAPQDQS